MTIRLARYLFECQWNLANMHKKSPIFRFGHAELKFCLIFDLFDVWCSVSSVFSELSDNTALYANADVFILVLKIGKLCLAPFDINSSSRFLFVKLAFISPLSLHRNQRARCLLYFFSFSFFSLLLFLYFFL